MKKRRKLKYPNLIIACIFLLAIAMYIFSKTFLYEHNVRLGIKLQKNQETILELSQMIETLQLDVQKLTTFDRINTIAAKDGLKLNGNSINIVN